MNDRINGVAKKIAFTAMFCAICYVLNLLYIPFGVFVVSFVPFICILAGIIINPLAGFTVGAVSDILGCITMGYPPNIYILLGSALWGFIGGCIFRIKTLNFATRIILSGVISYIICSALLNSYGLYSYTSKKVPFLPYVIARMPVQIPNLVVNIIILFFTIKGLNKAYFKDNPIL